MAEWVVTDLEITDRSAWERLYVGYGDFYETSMPPHKLATVWTWLHDPAHELSAIVVRAEPHGVPVGLAHYRPFVRPLHGSVGGFLDDLFVTPDLRGQGAAQALLAELRHRSAANGWDVVRWITRASNSVARRLYDQVATATDLVTYDIPVEAVHTDGMRFRAELQLFGRTATGLVVPEEIVTALHGGRRPAVTVRIGAYTWRTTIAPYGGQFLLGISAENRAGAGVSAGDLLDVDVALDTAPREVEVPGDLAAALKAAGAGAAFDKLSYTHRKEHVRAVEEAKRPETRQRRIEATVARLLG